MIKRINQLKYQNIFWKLKNQKLFNASNRLSFQQVLCRIMMIFRSIIYYIIIYYKSTFNLGKIISLVVYLYL